MNNYVSCRLVSSVEAGNPVRWIVSGDSSLFSYSGFEFHGSDGYITDVVIGSGLFHVVARVPDSVAKVIVYPAGTGNEGSAYCAATADPLCGPAVALVCTIHSPDATIRVVCASPAAGTSDARFSVIQLC